MKKSTITITTPYKNKALGLTATLLALSSVLGSASIANAATFTFSFDGTSVGPNYVAGTVSGTIVLPDAALTTDGTYAATSVVVTSAPSIGWPIPLDIFASAITVFNNVFNVVGGNIVEAGTNFSAELVTTPFTIFGLSTSTSGLGSGLEANPTPGPGGFGTGVRDTSSTTLMFNPLAASTPEPTSVITLIGVGVLGVASKLKKKA